MYWVFKTEPAECSMQDIMQASEPVLWFGVRNYQARNFLRDQVQIGDLVLIHHSSCAEVGLAGIATVTATGFADPTQFEVGNLYYDAKATSERWPWYAVSISPVRQFARILSLAELRQQPELSAMTLLKKGNRLSVMPVTKAEFDLVLFLTST
jgi:predicted RNA-binding protein with PUA-like domain